MTTEGSVSSFVGKKTTARKNTVKGAAIGTRPGRSSQIAKRTVQAASSSEVVNSGDEQTNFSQHQADIRMGTKTNVSSVGSTLATTHKHRWIFAKLSR